MVRAPGKAMLFGEYAVLDGAFGVVGAVDRYAFARLADGAPASPFVAAGVDAARVLLAQDGRSIPHGIPLVDTRQLFDGAGRKLGLGSSAAVTVVAFGAVLDAAGLTVAREITFAACAKAHALAQGVEGSGLDVAAAVWGRTIRARRRGATASSPIEIESAGALLRGHDTTLVDTGVAASTADRVARYRALDRGDRAVARLLGSLRSVADRVAERPGDAPLAESVDEWNALLCELEQKLGAEIITPAHRRISELARAAGGCAKPSGAGGGDLAICFTPVDQADGSTPGKHACVLRARLAADGFHVLTATIGAPGLGPDHEPAASLQEIHAP
ncbi:MAG: hypothetical protein EXR72_19325 [Myxococcales bacterium]|nr:hypothetical protein [Myxococcales bacterium]